MGIKDWMFGRRASDALSEPAVPDVAPADVQSGSALVPVSGTSGAQLGFMDGHDGKRSMTWAQYHAPMTGGYTFYGTPGSEVSRERNIAAAVTADMLTGNSTIATLVENLATHAVGNGLTLSSRPDFTALGITPEAARELANQIERQWLAYTTNAAECDASGRHELHQLAVAAFKSWLVTGETLFAIDYRPVRGTLTVNKVKLFASSQLDQSITRSDVNGSSIMQGVQYDSRGRLEGYWIRPYVLGNSNSAPAAVFERAYTSWGRRRILHLFDLVLPGQIRGLSPLTAALTAAKSKGQMREFTLAAALVQTLSPITIESDLPSVHATGAFNIGEFSSAPGGTSQDEWLKASGDFYAASRVSLTPGVISHMNRGDKLHVNRAETPNSTYEAFDWSLSREAAKASGSSAEDLDGNYSKTSYSAARLSGELPWRINLRRRSAIVESFYRGIFSAWLEESIEVGRITLPSGAPAFWENPNAYTASQWRGSAKPVADPLKAAQADILEIENGLTTLEAKLGERGLDFEEVLAQRKSEKEQLEKAGFTYPTPKAVLQLGPDVIAAEER